MVFFSWGPLIRRWIALNSGQENHSTGTWRADRVSTISMHLKRDLLVMFICGVHFSLINGVDWSPTFF